MKHYFTLICGLLFYFGGFAQKENNIWNFGSEGHGLDFNSGSPVLISTSGEAAESCASVCDTAGQLLFYTDGMKIFDRTGAVMPNGSGLSGDPSSTQGASIASIKNSDSLYFVFTLSGIENTLNYSVVDMSLNGGLGDIVPGYKDIWLRNIFTEKMMIAGNCGNQWMIVHHGDSAIFYAYPLGSSLSPGAPVVSMIGDAYGPNTFFAGEMNMSTDFRHIAMNACKPSTVQWGYVQLFDFDKVTGTVYHYRKIDSSYGFHYGIEFSPDGSKLYVSPTDYSFGLYQYDLSLGTPAAIRSSKYIMNPGTRFYGMRRGPDGKLYIIAILSAGVYTFYTIESPNQAGAACEMRESKYLKLNDAGIIGNLGNYYVPRVQNWADTVRYTKRYILCKGDVKEISGWGYYTYRWENGDTSSWRIVPSTTAQYVLTAVHGCQVRIDTFFIEEKPLDSLELKSRITACFVPFIKVAPDSVYEEYLWGNGSRGSEMYLTSSVDSMVLNARNPSSCRVLHQEFKASFVHFASRLQDTFFCTPGGIHIDASVAYPEAQYLWNSGDTTPVMHIHKSGDYYLSIDVKGCKLQDTLTVQERQMLLDIGPDTTLCEGSELILSPNINGGTYTWSTGAGSSSIRVISSGLYSLSVEKDGCKDTAEAHIRFHDCYQDCVQVPNAFTPDGDGRNDAFKPIFSCPVSAYQFKIFNRWGQIVFSTTNSSEAWDGTFNGKAVNSGTYFYYLKMLTKGKFEKETLIKGDVTLVK